MTARRLRSERGFSLLETLVIAGITGTLAAITFPSMSSALNAHRLKAGLRTTAGSLRAARSAAVSRNVPARIVVSGDGKTLTVEASSGGSWTTIGTAVALEGGVTITSVSPSDGLVFTGQGTVANPVTVTLTNANGDTSQVTVALLGGIEAS